MVVSSPEAKKILNEYDITSLQGIVLPVTIDLDAGDTIDFDEQVIRIHLSAKLSQLDPDRMLPAENITVFVKNIFTVQHRTREIVQETPEQREAWKGVLQELSQTVQ